MLNGLFELRDSLNEMVRCCADNVEIAIYVNHILDRAIVIKRGNCENRIRITIKSNGEVTHSWTKETTSTKLWNWFYGFLGLIQKFGGKLIATLIMLRMPMGWLSKGSIAIGLIAAICEK